MEERRHYREIYSELKKESNNINNTAKFIEERTKRIEEKIDIVSTDKNDINIAMVELKNSLTNINTIINERLNKR